MSTKPLVTTLATVAAVALLVGCAAIDEPVAGDTSTEPYSCTEPRTATRTAFDPPTATPPTPDLPTTTTDFTGETVVVEDASRILALDTYGTLASTVIALGLGGNLVGRDISTTHPSVSDLPVVTHNGHQLNAEAILDLDPTVILTDYSIGPIEVQLQLQASGIPVAILDGERGQSLIDDQINAVAATLGVPEAGSSLAAEVADRVAVASEEVAARRDDYDSAPPRIVFLYLRGNAGVYYWFGKDSGADDLIEALGGVDVATESGLEGYRPVTAEGLIAAAPEVVLLMTDGLASVGGLDGLLSVPGVADTPAGENRCVIDMADGEILSFGPAYPETLTALGDAVYPDR